MPKSGSVLRSLKSDRRDIARKLIVIATSLITLLMGLRFFQKGLISVAVPCFLAVLAYYTLFLTSPVKNSTDLTRAIVRSIARLAEKHPFFNFVIMAGLLGTISAIAVISLMILSIIDLRAGVLVSNEVAGVIFVLIVVGVFGELISSIREKV